MSNALPAKDQSMDEILASIRRIIETGDKRTSSSATRAAASASKPAPAASSDVEASGTVTDFPAQRQEPPRENVAATAPQRTATPHADRQFAAEAGRASGAETMIRRDGLDAAPKAVGREPLEARIYESEAREFDSLAGLDEVGLADATAAMHSAPSEAATPVRTETPARVSANAPRSIRRPAPVEPEPLPQWPEAVAANDRAADFAAEMFLDEFDEEGFASDLLNDVEAVEEPATVPEAESQAEWSEYAEGLPAVEDAVAVAESVDEISDAKALAAATDSLNVAHALISQEAGERVAASFSDLASAIRDEHLRDVDGVVREMLRPMLQEWLDENLPRMVEHMVREEISRIARGNRT